MPYLTELCLFAAAFIAAYHYGDTLLKQLGASGAAAVTRRLARWGRRRGGRGRRS